KPWVKVGISPFGIWRPGNPPGVRGLDAYAEIYADSRKWLREGWCDYFAPELYWPTTSKGQNFAALLDWWNGENTSKRYVWPGLDTDRVGRSWQSSEIANQIGLIRKYPNPGELHWSMLVLMKNAALDEALTNELYTAPALIPPFPWLGSEPPLMPELTVTAKKGAAQASWKGVGTNSPSWWLLQSRKKEKWITQIFPAGQSDAYLDDSSDAIAVRAVSRTGILSEAAVWSRSKFGQKQRVK
ncbi:MAG TPA: family 10 glycosylhydrolase, partial [Verrucomicrobiae bacterium]|nr:family 10 glycosylhydrolase [Verrucomicrobiae bacterium]